MLHLHWVLFAITIPSFLFIFFCSSCRFSNTKSIIFSWSLLIFWARLFAQKFMSTCFSGDFFLSPAQFACCVCREMFEWHETQIYCFHLNLHIKLRNHIVLTRRTASRNENFLCHIYRWWCQQYLATMTVHFVFFVGKYLLIIFFLLALLQLRLSTI